MTEEEYLIQSSRRGWKFQLVSANTDAQNLAFIHPIKQELTGRIASKAKDDPCVRRVIVFGSSVTNRCNPFSDLDLCIDWYIPSHDEDGVYVPQTRELMRFISMSTQGNCDILAYDDITNEDIKQAVDEGVVIYEHDV